MFNKMIKKTLITLLVLTSPIIAGEIDLVALKGTTTIGASTIDMWGYAEDTGQSCATIASWDNGPIIGPDIDGIGIHLVAGDDLTINLRNCLDVDVSLFIPGMSKATDPVFSPPDIDGRQRVESFDEVATANGGTMSYTWSDVQAGTYLYQSGTHPQVQVQMGLYGAVIVQEDALQAYPGHTVAQEQLLLYSEIDPAVHADPSAASITAFDYLPKHFLINGRVHPDVPAIAMNAGQDMLLRFVNAGFEMHAPTLHGSYMKVIAEDHHLYKYPVEQYQVELAPLKTMDAIVNVNEVGEYALIDRSAGSKDMIAFLDASAPAGVPTADDDGPYSVDEDTLLSVIAASGVLIGDSDGGAPGTGLTPLLVNGPFHASSFVLHSDGSFDYMPSADYNGADSFMYVANDGVSNSNIATVSITVDPINDFPVANDDDDYEVLAGTTLNVAALDGVLANDTDAENASLTVFSHTAPVGGSGALNVTLADGSFDYDATGDTSGDVITFDYVATDGSLNSGSAQATITVIDPPANIAPIANDDFATAPRNSTGMTFSVTSNDSDEDGSIDPTSVVVTSGPKTSRGGTVVENGDGTVTYVPKKNFRGTDTFTYVVDDNDGATSNEATVRINVVK